MNDGRKHAAVAMWTQQEGRSELTLELHLFEDDDASCSAHVLGLHVL